MDSLTVASISFVCIFGGAMFGLYVRSLLPGHHLTGVTMDTVKIAAGLIATLAAMVLGLLVTSAKGTLDSMNSELTQEGVKVIIFDRVLKAYGPETQAIRADLRNSVTSGIEMIWPEHENATASIKAIEAREGIERIQQGLRELSPRTDVQRQLHSQALQLAAEMAQTRWLLIVQSAQPLPLPFLIVLLLWLTALFACIGLIAPGNPTNMSVLLICALSLSAAIFLIIEMSTPLTGIIKVSSAPLHKALAAIGK
ncbi:hypothetical protein [Geomonas sp.]|uniref:bestrophin-like domain n=1 Tax=Geomonas sp. TaxID=2651584 RepID=UPI002B475ABE|nr:hypothetical protein [Geomonas sp.]HJV37145.1 hypothetical protein [Geomonas sp.]